MQIVSLVSKKGGAGKTTLAVNLAVAATKAGAFTIVVDLDPQACAMAWHEQRDLEHPLVVPGKPSELMGLIALADMVDADMVFIDCPPGDDTAAREASAVADLAVIPCRLGVPDLRAVEQSVALAEQAGTPAALVLTQVPPRSSLMPRAQDLLAPLPVDVAPMHLTLKNVYNVAHLEGLGLHETDTDKNAQAEMQQCFAWIKDQIRPIVGAEVVRVEDDKTDDARLLTASERPVPFQA